MRQNDEKTIVYMTAGLILNLTVPCVPWSKTRETFVNDEMKGQQTRSEKMRNALSSAYAWMIRDAVGEGLIEAADAADVGEGFLGEIGMQDRIRANCYGKRPWQMTLAEFSVSAGYFSNFVSPGPGHFVFVKDDPGYFPKEISVAGSPEETVRQAYHLVLQLAVGKQHPVPAEILAEYAELA